MGFFDAVTPEAPAVRFTSQHHQTRECTPKAALSLGPLLGVLFVAVIGGAYGLEDCVRTGGPLVTIIFLCVLPWLWGLPTALCVAELGSAVPSNAGVDMWINIAFPPWFTCMSLCWTFFINRVDNSLYPNLFVDYLAQIVDLAGWHKALLKCGFVLFCMAINIRGVEIIGQAGIALALLSVLPFVAMVAWEVPQLNTEDWNHVPASIDWKNFLPMIAWNVSGFDSAGHIVEEVKAGAKTLVVALVQLLVITQLVYLLPILAGVSAQSRRGYGGSDSSGSGLEARTDYSDWEDGYFATVSDWVGGEWQRYLMVIGGCMSALGFMASLLCTTSRALQGHAALGLFPAPVCRFLTYMHPTYRTPVNAIVVNSLLCLGISLILEFDTLVNVDQVLYSLRLMAIFGACFIIRVRYPGLPRPFRIPVGTTGLVVFLALPFLFCVACAGLGAVAEPKVFAIAVALVGASAVFAVPFSIYVLPGGFDGRIEPVPADDEQPSSLTQQSFSGSAGDPGESLLSKA
eukprot:TRINITY_DN31982_c0_g1_i1.p1 TRINITY_DN31982_c0_g1~~TRINITY_DN31982_c0_g1_i1.p1  ORF type:complete len:532 (+),score=171.35 TRINITY_DN31982_c0_g1_i1:54-1598(+)